MKKIIAFFLIFIFFSFLSAPIFAQNPENKITEPPLDCWTKTSCEQDNGSWGDRKEARCPIFNNEETRFCYTKPPVVNLQVSIGGSQVKGLTDYIPRIYNYGVGIVSSIAIIMIMVGGFQYLISGGNSGKVSKAKERIFGAIIGLILLLGSYTLLNTINPDLIKLKLPPIKKIRNDTYTARGNCTNGGATPLGGKCNNTCECTQGKCVPIEAGALEDVTSGLVKGTVAVASSVYLLGAGSVTQGAKVVMFLAKKSASLATTLASYSVKHPVVAGLTGYGLYELPSSDKEDGPGICMIEANKNVPSGGWCSKNEHCISGSCIKISALNSLVSGGMGVCSGGNLGDPCEKTCNSGLRCLDSSDGEYIKQCSDGKAGTPCSQDSDCKDTGYTCKSLGLYQPKQCVNEAGSISNTTKCLANGDCDNLHTGFNCINNYCSDGTDGGNCNQFQAEQGNAGACDNGYTCAFYANFTKPGLLTQPAWIENTGDRNDYSRDSLLLSTWENQINATKYPRGTQCKPSAQVFSPNALP